MSNGALFTMAMVASAILLVSRVWKGISSVSDVKRIIDEPPLSYNPHLIPIGIKGRQNQKVYCFF